MAMFNGARWAHTAIAALMAAGMAVAADRPLQITAVEGEGAINDIRRGVGRATIVEVKDDTGAAVENAKVVFQLPETGASGTFLDGSRTFVGTTDRQGRAAAPVLKPNKIEGSFTITVTASKDGNSGRSEIRESNTLAGGQMAKAGGGHGTALKIVLAVASVGGAVAAFAARSGGGGSNSGGGSTGGAAATPTSLSVGTVTIGGPR